MKSCDWLTRKKIRNAEENTDILKNFSRTLKHLLPNFRYDLLKVRDSRDYSYTIYKPDIMLLARILASICGIESMNELTRKFNNKNVIHNLNQLTSSNYEEVPHYTTVNNYLRKVRTDDLESVRTKMIKELISKKCFYDYRLLDNIWKVAIDGTGVYTFDKRHCEHCLTRTYNKGTEEEKTIYFHYVLEAKLIIGDMALSIASEFIENPSAEFKKQDCELKAFYRLEGKIKKAYPRLPICLIFDSLYANRKVFKICKKNRWQYIIRFEDGSIPTLAEDFKGMEKTTKINELENTDTYIFFNDISYDNYKLNMIKYITEECNYPFCFYLFNKINK